MKDLVIVGVGGFGRETADTVRAINAVQPTWKLVGFVDDAPSLNNLKRLEVLGLPHLGGVADIPMDVDVAIGVGSPTVRRQLAKVIGEREHDFPSLIHPSATVGSAFVHGVGLIVLAGVSVGTNVLLGNHVHLNGHVVLGHDTRLDAFVSVNPNATVSGECSIGQGTLLGASSTVLQCISVGTGVTIGAAACVTRSMPDGCVAVGVPATPLQKGKSA